MNSSFTPASSSLPISAESGPGRPPEVPRVPAVLLPARLAASVRRAGPAGRRRVAPPPAGPAPAREAGARRRRREEQEGPPEPHRVHGAAADGPGEALREAEVPVHARQVSPACSARKNHAIRKEPFNSCILSINWIYIFDRI